VIGPDSLRRWIGVPLLTLLSFPRPWGLESRAAASEPLAAGLRSCRQLTEDLAECAVLDDAPGSDRLRGLEWVLSDSGYRRLPPEAQACWKKRPGGYWVSRGSPSESWRGPDVCR
jgi:hypothetical protein